MVEACIEHMKRAIDLARDSYINKKGGPFGAVLVDAYDGGVLAEGQDKVFLDKDITSHAIINCIRNASKILDCYNLYKATDSYTINKENNLVLFTSSYPCPMCLNALKLAGIKYVYFSADQYASRTIGYNIDNLYYYTNYPYKFIEIKGFLNELSDELFKEIGMKDKIPITYYDK